MNFWSASRKMSSRMHIWIHSIDWKLYFIPGWAGSRMGARDTVTAVTWTAQGPDGHPLLNYHTTWYREEESWYWSTELGCKWDFQLWWYSEYCGTRVGVYASSCSIKRCGGWKNYVSRWYSLSSCSSVFAQHEWWMTDTTGNWHSRGGVFWI